MASIQKKISKDGAITYRVQVRLKGYPSQSATFKRKTDANRWIQHTESAIREGRYFRTIEAKKHTLGELIDRRIKSLVPSKKEYGLKQASQLKWWKQELGHYRLSDITPALIAEKRDKLLNGITCQGTKRSSSTTVRYMSTLSHAFSIAIREWGWIEDSPMRKVSKPTEPRGRVRFLDTDERTRLLEACSKSHYPYLLIIVTLAISTGMRYSEIMNLSWSNVDFERCRITLHETKNGESRVIPLVGKSWELLKQHESNCRMDTVLIFPSRNPQKPSLIRYAWQKALLKANIANFRFHDLRHSCASYLAMNGASISEIAEVLGHKTFQMVKRYAHLSEAHTTQIVKRMNKKIFG